MRIDVEEVLALHARLKEIRSIDMNDAEFYHDGNEVKVPIEVRDGWIFTGLSIDYFVVDLLEPEYL